MEEKTKNCPICGSGSLTKETIKEKFDYKGKILIIENYVIYRCADCKEEIVDDNTLKDTEKLLVEFQRKVDNLLTPEEIKDIRTLLRCTQEEIGMILGGGKKAFARYEKGIIAQSRAMDNQLRLLRKHPELLAEIAGYMPINNTVPRLKRKYG